MPAARRHGHEGDHVSDADGRSYVAMLDGGAGSDTLAGGAGCNSLIGSPDEIDESFTIDLDSLLAVL